MHAILETKTFDTGVVRLSYAEAGNPGGRPLILLHGGAWCWQEFLPLLPELCLRHHVYALDLRGHGGSEHAPGHYRLLDFTDDVTRFLTERVGAPAVLMGHSVGSVVAAMVAGRQPEQVCGLVLEEPAVTLRRYREIVQQNLGVYATWSKVAALRGSALEKMRALADSDVDLGAGPVRFGDIPGVTNDLLMFLGLCLRSLDPSFLPWLGDNFECFVEGYDPEDRLPRLSCPTLLLHGESRLGGVMTADDLADARRILPAGALIVGHEGMGHELHMKSCEPIARSVTRFLELLPTRGHQDEDGRPVR